MNRIIFLDSKKATLNLGRAIAQSFKRPIAIYLYGELGVGKTTLVRGFLQSLGYKGNIKSPTYSLIEPYVFNRIKVYHIDLYRIINPKELEYIGIRHYFDKYSVCLVEWPQRGLDILPNPDIRIYISYQLHSREVYIDAVSSLGVSLLEELVLYFD